MAKTPRGWADAWEDAIPFVGSAKKKTTPKSVKQSLKATATAGKVIKRGGREVRNFAVGDPKEGPASMAFNVALWAAPYGKAFKVVDKAVKGGKVVASAKAAAKGSKGVKKVVKGAKGAAGAAGKKTVRGVGKSAIVIGGGYGTSSASARVRRK